MPSPPGTRHRIGWLRLLEDAGVLADADLLADLAVHQVAPTEGLPLHTLSRTAHNRSPPSASIPTSANVGPADAGEQPRTGVNETKTEPRTSGPQEAGGRPARALAGQFPFNVEADSGAVASP